MKMWYDQICIAYTPQSIPITPSSKYRLSSAYEPKETLRYNTKSDPNSHQDSSTNQDRSEQAGFGGGGRDTSYQCHDHCVQVEEKHDQVES